MNERERTGALYREGIQPVEDAVQEAKVLVKWEIPNQTDIPHLSFGREVFST